MPTKKSKAKADPDKDTGKPLPEDRWPRIAQSPHVLNGHAHIRGTEVPVFKVLRAMSHEPLPVPMLLVSKGIREEDIRAAINYSADVQEHMQRLIIEVQRLHGIEPKVKP